MTKEQNKNPKKAKEWQLSQLPFAQALMANNLNVVDFVKKANAKGNKITTAYVYGVLSGRKKASEGFARMACELLGITPAEFWGKQGISVKAGITREEAIRILSE